MWLLSFTGSAIIYSVEEPFSLKVYGAFFVWLKKKKNGYVFAIFKLDQGGYIAWLENCYWE